MTESSLGHKTVGKIHGSFFVPQYQRGYRWDRFDVQRLLDDIWNSKGKECNLQPVVVKLKHQGTDDGNHVWELIDGQQRLTTLYLIFFYMKKHGWKSEGSPYSISYETRKDSAEYLQDLDPSKCKKNIDYFHLYQAYQTTQEWFEKARDGITREEVVSTFADYLDKSVRVIWYQADSNMDSIELFTRLNVGRIPLTDAELIKAQLLAGVGNEEPMRVEELAAQWDGIERDLRDPDMWAFVTGMEGSGSDEKYPTRISLLLDTLAYADAPVKRGVKPPRYHTFTSLCGRIQSDASEFWNRVVELHALILGWFDNPSLYNKIGLLVFTGTPIGELVELAREKRKSEFERLLVERIRSRLDISESGVLELKYNNRNDHPKLLSLLLLMNVETVSRTGQRFPFRRHVGKTWSLEHIHAQNAEGLTKAKQWKAWLESHKKALEAIGGQFEFVQKIEIALQEIITTPDFGRRFQNLAGEVMEVFKAPLSDGKALDHELHSISNLALLSIDVNSGLSNAVFEVKRQIVLDIDRNMDRSKDNDRPKDGYIPVCTRNVFLKYYTGADAQQIHFWSPQDRESYFNAIISTLKNYLIPEEQAK